MLTCTKCKETKPANPVFFPLHNAKKNGLDSWCRTCRATYRSDIRRGNYRKFGLTDESLKALLQDAACAICGDTESTMCVDHDHVTKKVRGILCSSCNLGLGKFKDDPELLEFARIYLLAAKNDPEAEAYLAANTVSEDTQ